MKKNIYLLLLILLLSGVSYSYWQWDTKDSRISGPYAWKIQECLDNQDSPRTIEDFVCIQWSKEDIIYQVVLDQEFKKLDKKIEDYLDGLEKDKSHYFGPDKKEDYTKWIDDIEYYLWEWWEFEQQYKDLCETKIIAEAIEAEWWETSNIVAKDYLQWTWDKDKCKLLYKIKLMNYRNTAYAIMKKNKAKVLTDNHKTFTQQVRKKFDDLLDFIMVNVWYLERIASKWQSKTKHPN